jgi:hypothetical protein
MFAEGTGKKATIRMDYNRLQRRGKPQRGRTTFAARDGNVRVCHRYPWVCVWHNRRRKRAPMVRQYLDILSVSDVPEPNLPIGRPTNDAPAIKGETDSIKTGVMANKTMDHDARPSIP